MECQKWNEKNGRREERADFQDHERWHGLSERTTSKVRADEARENSSGKEVQRGTELRS